MRIAGLAWRQLKRDLASGDVRILLAALVLAVVAVTAVGFVTDRAARALAIGANRLLGRGGAPRGGAPRRRPARHASLAPGLPPADTADLHTLVRGGRGEAAPLTLGDVPARGASLAPGLQHADAVELDTMVRVGRGEAAQLKLGELRAIGEGFPLRGEYRIAGADGVERAAGGIPAPGTLWMSRGGADT